MALSYPYEGSASPSGTTEYSFPNATTYSSGSVKAEEGIFSFFLDMNAMTSAETYRIRIYEKVRSTSSPRTIVDVQITGDQDPDNWVFPSLHLKHGWDWTITKVSGTDRSFDYSIRKIA